MQKIYWLLLALIVALSLVLRIYKVTEIPPSLNWDEVSIGYNAYSILKTGHDEWGEFLPVHFKSYGEYKLPAQIYASIPAIFIFGLNDFSVRITPVIYGTLTVLILFFLARRIFNNPIIGLISALFLAISPWHLQLTRGSFESSFSAFWVVLGIWFFVKAFGSDNKKIVDIKWLFLSMVPFALSIYTYNSARVFTPLFLTAIFVLFRKQLLIRWKAVVMMIVLFILMMVPLIQFTLSGEGSARYKLVSITDDPGLVPRINERRGASSLPQPLPTLVHNKVTYVGFYFVRNYISHFSPQFLFITGAPHKQHHVQNIGELYLFQAPFVLLGLFYLYKRKSTYRWVIIAWVLLTFIPVSATNDSIPHALRTLIANPAFQIIAAVGIYYSFQYMSKKDKKFYWGLVIALCVIAILSVIHYLIIYYGDYRYLYSRDWQYGNKEVVEYINDHYQEYDMVVYTRHYGEPHMFMLFYLNYDPEQFYNNSKLERFETYDWVRVLKFDKFFFPDLGDNGTRYQDIANTNPDKKILFIGKEGDFPSDIQRLKVVNFLNGETAFEVVEKR